MKKPPFSDNVIIITGASRGIGRALGLQLAGQGAWLTLAARNAERLEQVAAECRERGGRALEVTTDVAEESQCRNLIERTAAEYGRIDTLINNAGITMRARVDELLDPGLIEHIMRVNYTGSVYCTFYALPHLKESRGRIVGISSLSGRYGVPRVSGYSASKHAMAGFFDSLRVELAATGITVTMIYPSFVATGVRQVRPGVMPVETCAALIIRAAARRRRELVMTLMGRIGLWGKLIAPALVDRFARTFMEREEYAAR
jgi:NAD(P)-dependent dehydrogenase (short-subunit alcohol dehydrogenase family)